MWSQTLVLVLALSTALPIQVLHAAHSERVEKLRKMADDILVGIKQYGPLIVKLIAPFVAKKLIELGVIYVGKQVVGKREAPVEGATEIEAAEKYLLQKFNAAIDSVQTEFHKRIDMEAIGDHVDNAEQILRDLVAAAHKAVQDFMAEYGVYDFATSVKDKIKGIWHSIISKRAAIHTELDQEALNKYDNMLKELREVLKKKFGHRAQRSVIHTELDQDSLNKYDVMLNELREVLKKKFGSVPELVVN